MNHNLFTGSAGALAHNFFKLMHVEKEWRAGAPALPVVGVLI